MNAFSSIHRAYRALRSIFSRVPGGKPRSLLLKALVVLAALVALAVVVFLGLSLLPLVPMAFWQLSGLCLVALAVLWWFTSGAKRFSLAGRTRKRIGDLGPGNPEDEREPLARMTAAINEAKRTIARSPEMEQGRDPLYRIPWMLFVGDQAANVPGLLEAAARVSPFPPPGGSTEGTPPVWRWWFFKSMIAIETDARLVCDTADRLERGLWYQALMQLAHEREKLPLNGICVCIDARTLAGDVDALKTLGSRLRRLVDEAMEHLDARMPVYFMVSGLERLPGYAAFRGSLPSEAFAQALGHRLGGDAASDAAAGGQLNSILGPILDRLHALRMTALREQATPAARRGVFEFVESLRRTEGGLRLFVELLLEDNPFQHTPRWRGLYFTGAGSQDSPGGAFVADLFTRFLPADQPLATPSLRGKAARVGVASLGVAALLGLSALLAYGLSVAHRDDTQLLARTQVACSGVDSVAGSGRITWVAGCGRTIEALEADASGTLFGFGIRRADRDIVQLRERVVQDFESLILAPYEQMLETDLGAGRAGLDHLLAVSQRLRLLQRCRKQREECRGAEQDHNVVFDARSRLFAPFVSADNNTRLDRDNASALFGAYLGYLRWQKKNVLDAEAERLKQQLGRLLADQPMRAADVEAWADHRRPPLALSEFWLADERVVGVDPDSLPSVSRAYSLDTYQGIVAPMLATVGRHSPDAKAAASRFETEYFDRYFSTWAQLQARFFEGLALWRGHYDELLPRAAAQQNPYRVYFRHAERELFGLPLRLPTRMRWSAAWTEMRAGWLSSWRPFGRFVAGTLSRPHVAAPPWLLATRDTQTGVLHRQAPTYTRSYLRLGAESAGQEVYQIAADVFSTRGAPTRAPGTDYAELIDAVDKPAERFAEGFSGDDQAAWTLVQGPARLLLFLTVYRAGEYVQARWQETVVLPLAALGPREQVEALYGEQGRLNAFVNDWLKPFITERERLPIQVAGVAMPLSPEYQNMVAAERRFMPVLEADRPFLAGSFTLTRPTQMGAVEEGATGTVLEIDCRERVYRASSAGQSLADAKAQVFWSPGSCLESRLKISLAEPAAPPAQGMEEVATPAPSQPLPPAIELTRIYTGPDGFVAMIEEFESGSRAFGLSDFRSSYSPEQWRELSARLRTLGFGQARVHLQVELSDEMNQFLLARRATPELPTRILD